MHETTSLLHSFASSEMQDVVIDVGLIEAAFEAGPQIIIQLCAVAAGSAELQDVAFAYTTLYGDEIRIKQGNNKSNPLK